MFVNEALRTDNNTSGKVDSQKLPHRREFTTTCHCFVFQLRSVLCFISGEIPFRSVNLSNIVANLNTNIDLCKIAITR